MPAIKIVTGTPYLNGDTSGFIATAGSEGSSARVLTLRGGSGPVLICNLNATATCYIAINGGDGAGTLPTWSLGGVAPAAGTIVGPLDVSLGGIIVVRTISLYLATGSYNSIGVYAWNH